MNFNQWTLLSEGSTRVGYTFEQRLLRYKGVLVWKCSYLEEQINSFPKEINGLLSLLSLHSLSSLAVRFLDFYELCYTLFQRNILATAGTTHILGQILGEFEQINTIWRGAPEEIENLEWQELELYHATYQKRTCLSIFCNSGQFS